MSLSNSIRLVTFDAFNTLFRPRGGISSQYVAEAAKNGIHISKLAIQNNFGKVLKAQAAKYPNYGTNQGMNSRNWWANVVRETFLKAGIQSEKLDPTFDKIFDTLYERYASSEGYEMFNDAEGTLQELHRRGILIGVISNTDERLVKVLQSFGISQYFNFTLVSAECGIEKPSREIFDMALVLAGNISANEALHVGDDVNKDYRGAYDAGWHTLLIDRTKLSYKDASRHITAPSQQSDQDINVIYSLDGILHYV